MMGLGVLINAPKSGSLATNLSLNLEFTVMSGL
jgi:hypothetical protein